MNILRFSLFALLILGGVSGHTFTLSEEENLQIDLREARGRATDFKAHIQRLEKMEKDREQHAQESKTARAAVEAQLERDRQAFVRERNVKVPDDTIRDRLEKEWEAEQARKEKVMDQARLEYLRKRAAVTQTIEREATIDENVEYGLTP
ncbi:MAG TPA: hypothetical protein VM432_04505 [Bdellovibrionales bacterium]|nr:hypothetical protein [Bdellovibrionales bacterium]